MKQPSTVKSALSRARKSPKYWRAMSAFQFGEGLRRLMLAEGIKQKDLAKKLSCSGAWISKVLNGTENLTLQKMSEIASALGGAVHVHVARQDLFVDWSEITREADERIGEFESEVAGASAIVRADFLPESDTTFALFENTFSEVASTPWFPLSKSTTGEGRYGREGLEEEARSRVN